MNPETLILAEAKNTLSTIELLISGILVRILPSPVLSEEERRIIKTCLIDCREDLRTAATCLNSKGGDDA